MARGIFGQCVHVGPEADLAAARTLDMAGVRRQQNSIGALASARALPCFSSVFSGERQRWSMYLAARTINSAIANRTIERFAIA
jgi:hypothetical protein